MDRKLIEYLPDIYKDIYEFKVINDVYQLEIEDLYDELKKLLDNQYVQTANEEGLSRWEKILNISNKFGYDLEERRFKILTRLNEQLPYTLRTLQIQLNSLCGDDGYISLRNEEYTLIVRVALTAKKSFNDVLILLKRVVPANMIIDLSLKYNQHSLLKEFTHVELSKFTHNQLRNEVLRNGG